MNKKIKKWLIMGLITSSVAIFGISYAVFSNIDEKTSSMETRVGGVVDMVESKKSPKKETVLNAEELKDGDEMQLVRYIHRMTHPVIKANAKWMKDVVPTKENVKKAMKEIDENGYDFDGHVQEVGRILNDFSKGEFKEAHKLHNIMWDMQDGVTGKARGVDKRAIREVIKLYY